MNSTEFLGLKLTADGISPSDKHVQAIKAYPVPQSKKDVRTFLGLVNYFRKHIPQRAQISAPLNELTRKDAEFKWSKEC